MMFVAAIGYAAFFFGGLEHEKYNEEFGPSSTSNIDSGAGSN